MVNISALILYSMAVILLLIVTKCARMDKKAYTNIGIYLFSFAIKALASIIIKLDPATDDSGPSFEKL